MAEVGCAGLYARALAKHDSPAAGLGEIDRLEAYMKALRLDPRAHSIHWSIFHHAKALVLETAGDYRAAAEFLTVDGPPSADRLIDYQRIKAKLPD